MLVPKLSRCIANDRWIFQWKGIDVVAYSEEDLVPLVAEELRKRKRGRRTPVDTSTTQWRPRPVS